jgi:hypothetical protein
LSLNEDRDHIASLVGRPFFTSPRLLPRQLHAWRAAVGELDAGLLKTVLDGHQFGVTGNKPAEFEPS